MKIFSPKNVLKATLISFTTLFILGFCIIYFYLIPRLPSTEVLQDVQLQVPLRIYSQDGKLIYEYGEKKRTPLAYSDIPPKMIEATLAAEDDRFFEHAGVDYLGLMRAAFKLVLTGEKRQGGSTITMQVVRNFLLSREKTYLRKLNEILLAFKIERELSKEEILTLYLNKIYYGNRAYGIGAAAQVYYGTSIDNLSIAQIAMIAGLPKAPSTNNPLANPERALGRRNYVLRRMHELQHISDEEYNNTLNEVDTATLHGEASELEAPYIAELVRAEMWQRFEAEAYTKGYRVYTTVDSRLQHTANQAQRMALLEYDRRHGYRGPEAHIELEETAEAEAWYEAIKDKPVIGNLPPALVLEVADKSAIAYTIERGLILLPWEGLSWAQPYISNNQTGPAPSAASDILKRGDIIRVQIPDTDNTPWRLAQIPQIEGALVAIAPRDGAIRALVGGFDFNQSKFNRVTQAQRQPGSNFKPFIYSAALQQGYTPATLVNDAPVVFEDDQLETAWRPENYSGRFYGPTRLREALIHSRNLVSIRLLQDIGVNYAINYVERFGFKREQLPKDLSLALGSGSVTPLQIATGYAVFANGGYRVEPYFITRIEGSNGESVYQASPATVCPECEAALATEEIEIDLPAMEAAADMPPASDLFLETLADEIVPDEAEETPPLRLAEQVLDPQVHFQISSMMRDVVKRGTARRARALGRNDLAGKTGTTNDQQDAWFSGFHPELVTTAWVGFDQPAPLGSRETGGRAALPMWIQFMAEALKGIPEQPLVQPAGMVTVRIDPRTGLLADSRNPDAIFETFRAEYVPRQTATTAVSTSTEAGGAMMEEQDSPEELF